MIYYVDAPLSSRETEVGMPTYGACEALVVRDTVGIADSAVDPTSFREEPVSRSSGSPSTFTYVA